MNNGFGTVVGFTVRNKLRGKAFIITTIIIAIIMSIGINLPNLISKFSGGGKATIIGYINQTGEQSDVFSASKVVGLLEQYYKAQQNPEVTLKAFADTGSDAGNEQELKNAIADKAINGYLEFNTGVQGSFPSVVYKSTALLDTTVSSSLQTALLWSKQQGVLQNSGIDQQQMEVILAPIKLDSVQISTAAGTGTINNGKSQAQQKTDMLLVYVIIVMLFMGIITSGQMIASEITSEKSSRVMEILITSISPLTTMFGKITGVFITALTQLAIYIAVIVINIRMPQNAAKFSEWNIQFSDIDPALLIYALLFFFTGYFLFATMFAAVGSIVSRTEDLGQAVMPITILSLAGFYTCIYGGIANPGSMLIRVFSFIPFFSPYAMVVRLGLSDPPGWQVWLSLAILIITIAIAGWLSAKIYRTGVLMYGKRPSYKELRKAMKSFKI